MKLNGSGRTGNDGRPSSPTRSRFGRLPEPPGQRRPRAALPQRSLSARRSGGERRPQRPSGGLGRLSGSSLRRGPGHSGLSPSGTKLGGSSRGSCNGPGTPKGFGAIRMLWSPSWPSCTRSWRSSVKRSRSSGYRCDRPRRRLGDEMQHASRVWQLPWQQASGSSAGWSSRRSSAAFVPVSPRTRCTHLTTPERRPSRRATRSWLGSSGRSIRRGSCRKRSGAGGLTRRRRPTSTHSH